MPRKDYIIPSYCFSVQLDSAKISFSKVSNISGSIEIDTITNGGFNDSPVVLRKPKKSPDMLVLEKGVFTTADDIGFSVFKEGTKINSIMITVMRDGKAVRMFSASHGVIVKRQFSNLDAMESEVLLETLQIAHTGITEVAIVN